MPGLTALDLAYVVSTMLLATLVAGAVLRRPHRYPAPAGILVIVLVFVLALTATGVDPVLIVALVGSVGVAAARLAPRRSSRI